MKHLQLAAAAAFALTALAASAHEFKAGAIAIGHPFARTTVPGQPTGGGFMTFTNQGKAADKLLSARAAVAGTVELHTMRMEGDVMRMRQVDAVELSPGATVELKPGGLHMMLVGLKQPLKAGDTFALTLRFEKAGEVTVQVEVEAAKPAAAPERNKQ